MKPILKQIIVTTIFFSTINLSGQERLLVFIGQVDSIKFDKRALEQQNIQDSIDYANGIWTQDTTENGTVISTGPAKPMRMLNPYILTINVQKSFSTSLTYGKLHVRIWEHENPKDFIKSKDPFAFILTQKDSLGIYPTLDYYRVFKTWTGKWAEPVRPRKKIYPKAKKASFNYNLLKELETDYYQLIADELECCIEELRQLYGLEEKEIKTEPNNK
tara:strand:+ start:1353 stop:2003 length:651 start_codon:yes stop_codon:yes gene_type:complete